MTVENGILKVRFGKSLGLGVIACLMATIASASTENQLVRVASDAVPGKDLDIRLITDREGEVTHLRYTSPDATRDFGISGLSSGLVIMEHSGRVVVRLMSKTFDKKNGGVVTMDYLVNGLTGQRANFPIVVIREGSDWKVYVEEKGKRTFFTRMYLKSKRVMGQIVGVERITVSP